MAIYLTNRWYAYRANNLINLGFRPTYLDAVV